MKIKNIMKIIICFFVFSFLFSAKGIVLSINDQNYSLQNFYSLYSKKQWTRSDSVAKNRMFNDFIKRELCILEAKRLGFENDPDIYVKLRTQSNQLLVNETYEHLVAIPLIDEKELVLARNNAKFEFLLHHILIGHAGSSLAQPPSRTIDEALLLTQNIRSKYIGGASFRDLAKQHSNDPSVVNNGGRLGWVGWGLTVPEFQSAAFSMKKNTVSKPILTVFGYHLIFVEDIKNSDYHYMESEEYENTIVNLSKRTVRNKLTRAAIVYDSLSLIENNVFFNNNTITKIVDAYNKELSRSAASVNKQVNIVDILTSLSGQGVLFVSRNKGYGPSWFIKKFKEMPVSRQPVLDENDKTLSVFKNFVLQDIALYDGLASKITNTFSFRTRKNSLFSNILYDAYLKYLVNSVMVPDSLQVENYYEKHKKEKYSTKQAYVINELICNSQSVADSLLLLIDTNKDFSVFRNIAKDISVRNNITIRENSNPLLFSAASLLNKNEKSPVISMSNGGFSIIVLLEKIQPAPQPLSSVFSRIQSILLKEKQKTNKTEGVNSLFNKYNIIKHEKFLQ